MSESLINFERTWRVMLCLNPEHETLKFKSNKIGNILCPICDRIMIVEIKFEDFDSEELLNDYFEE